MKVETDIVTSIAASRDRTSWNTNGNRCQDLQNWHYNAFDITLTDNFLLAILLRLCGLLGPKICLFIWLFKLSTLSVPDEVYSRNVSCTLNLISTFSVFICNLNIFPLISSLLGWVKFMNLTPYAYGLHGRGFTNCFLILDIDYWHLWRSRLTLSLVFIYWT
jgi:uncharacterized protein YhhL (DUF1145 family)